MAHDTRAESETDIDQLRDARDPDGRKTYLTVTVDLTDKDWMQTLKDRGEAFRYTLSPEEATQANVHRAFDQALVAAERLADQDAKGAAIVVSPVHDLEVAQPLDRTVDTTLVLDDRPDLSKID